MKCLLLLVLLALSINSYSQLYYLNISEKSVIRNALEKNPGLQAEKIVNSFIEGERVISWYSEKLSSHIIVYFAGDKSNLTIIQPTTDESLQGMIQMLKKNYITISNTEWHIYSEGRVIQATYYSSNGKSCVGFNDITNQ